MMEPDEEADDVKENGRMSDVGELPSDDYIDVNDVSPQGLAESDETEGVTGPRDADADAATAPGLGQPTDVMDAVLPAAPSESDAPAAELAILSAEERALQQERIDHPLRFSPVTGERASPGHIFLPWKPPAQSLSLPETQSLGIPAASEEDPPAQAEDSNSGPQKIPLASLQRSPPQASGSAGAPPGGGIQTPPREDIGQPLPRLLVTVSLANAQMLFDDALKQASQHMAKQFRELAIGEIDFAAFKRRAEERAADYSLRGPVF
jgi:hypothetical protein